MVCVHFVSVSMDKTLIANLGVDWKNREKVSKFALFGVKIAHSYFKIDQLLPVDMIPSMGSSTMGIMEVMGSGNASVSQ